MAEALANKMIQAIKPRFEKMSNEERTALVDRIREINDRPDPLQRTLELAAPRMKEMSKRQRAQFRRELHALGDKS